MLKLVGIFVVIVVCCSVVQSQTTSRTTTKQPTTTTTTTSKSTISTTSKSTARTTTGVTTKTTTPQSTKKPATTAVSTIPPIVTYKMCSDINSTATRGFFQRLANVTIQESNSCQFTIIVPSDQRIQFSCSVLNFTSAERLTLIASADGFVRELVTNRVYSSWYSRLDLFSLSCHSDCWFNCKWTTIPATPPNTTDFKMCRHGNTETAVGNVQPIDEDIVSPRTCLFHVVAPDDYQVQLSCSVLNFTDTFPQVSFEIFSLDQFPELVVNRVYTSSLNVMMLIFYRPVNIDWFRCNWTMVPIPPSTTTDFRLCRHTEARTADGTIQPLNNDITGPPRECAFSIIAPVDQFLRISCSFANFTSPRNFVRLSEIAYVSRFITRLRCAQPELGKTYTSNANRIDLSARIEDGNWFKCNWTTTTIGPSTTSTTTQKGIFQLCRDTNSTAANGTIQQLPHAASDGCSFTIQAPPDQRIQLSCSVIDGMSLRVDEAVVSIESTTSYVNADINRVYTSLGSRLRLTSFQGELDWLDCQWTTIPAISEDTTKFELCRDFGTEKLSGTIRFPDWEPDTQCSDWRSRTCSFLITAPPGYRVQLSCPIIKNNVHINYLVINGAIDDFSTAYPLIFKNRIYTSISNRMYLLSEVGKIFWALCNWTSIPKTMTTDFKLCLDREATSTSGTIQPLESDREIRKPRVCPFTISLPPDYLISFSCPIVNLTSDSSVKIEGAAEMIDRPMANTIYVSTSNQMNISSTIVNSDWFMCKWTTIKIQKICQDRKVSASSGIIQPARGLPNESLTCLFTISVPFGQRVQMSCSNVDLNGRTSSLKFYDEMRKLIAYEPDVSKSYNSTGNRMFITAVINVNDWFSCQWMAV